MDASGNEQATGDAREVNGVYEKLSADELSRLRIEQAEKIVTNHMTYCAIAGLIPAPGLNFGFIMGLQLRMVYAIAEKYGESFVHNGIGAILATLLGGLFPASVSAGNLGSVLGVFGMVAGFVLSPITAAATTYAVGQVFIQHFESGKMITDMRAEDLREEFSKFFKKGRTMAEAAGA